MKGLRDSCILDSGHGIDRNRNRRKMPTRNLENDTGFGIANVIDKRKLRVKQMSKYVKRSLEIQRVQIIIVQA